MPRPRILGLNASFNACTMHMGRVGGEPFVRAAMGAERVTRRAPPRRADRQPAGCVDVRGRARAGEGVIMQRLLVMRRSPAHQGAVIGLWSEAGVCRTPPSIARAGRLDGLWARMFGGGLGPERPPGEGPRRPALAEEALTRAAGRGPRRGPGFACRVAQKIAGRPALQRAGAALLLGERRQGERPAVQSVELVAGAGAHVGLGLHGVSGCFVGARDHSRAPKVFGHA